MLRVGDVILCNYNINKNKWITKILSLQQKIDDGKATHAAIYTGNNQFLESNWKGTQFVSMPYVEGGKSYAILRWKECIDENKMHNIITRYYQSHKYKGYSYLGLLSAGISSIITYMINTLMLGKLEIKPIFIKEEEAPFCSELVAEIYEEYLESPLSKIKNDVITPNDIYRIKRFIIIQDFA